MAEVLTGAGKRTKLLAKEPNWSTAASSFYMAVSLEARSTVWAEHCIAQNLIFFGEGGSRLCIGWIFNPLPSADRCPLNLLDPFQLLEPISTAQSRHFGVIAAVESMHQALTFNGTATKLQITQRLFWLLTKFEISQRPIWLLTQRSTQWSVYRSGRLNGPIIQSTKCRF